MPHALIVDDDANFRVPLSELVQQEGFTTAEADSVTAARSVLRDTRPDLILVDLYLGDGTGLDLLEELDASGSTAAVLITAHASIDTAIEALRRGASDYLTKPVDIARLKTVLANIRRAHALREEVVSL